MEISKILYQATSTSYFVKNKSKLLIAHSKRDNCIICESPRKYYNFRTKKNISNQIKFINIPMIFILNQIRESKIMIMFQQKICIQCLHRLKISNWNEILYHINDKLILFDDTNDKHLKIAHELWRKSFKIQIVMKENHLKSFLAKMIYYLDDQKVYGKSVPINYKNLIGLRKAQINLFIKQVIQDIKNNASIKTRKSIYMLKNKIIEFDLDDQNLHIKVRKYIISLLLKWKIASGNSITSSLIQTDPATFAKYIYKGTVISKDFAERNLINTYEKLCQETIPLYNRLIGVDEKLPVIIGDGVRYKCSNSVNHHNSYKMFDNKHKFQAYNTMGFCSITGKYCGFWPLSGSNSDGQHSDGRIIDWLVLDNNHHVVPGLFKTNSKLFANDGTLFIFDRALAHGSYCYNHGILNVRVPCPDKGKLSAHKADKTRYDATAYRWQIESCFGIIGKKWPIFQSKNTCINGHYIPWMGEWLNIAGALCNKFNIGMHPFSEQRMKETKWMITKKVINYYKPKDKSYLHLLLNSVIHQKSIKKEWKKVDSVNDLIKESNWTMKDLVDTFQLSDDELRLLGGGIFPVKQSKQYLIHSRPYIKLYYSTTKKNENILLINGFKKKMSRIYCTKNNKNKKRQDHKFHSVLLTKRNNPVINIWNNDDYTKKMRDIDFACTCVCGQRQITADSHVISALTFLSKYFIPNNEIPLPLNQRKYDELVDIYFFLKKIEKMSGYERNTFFENICDEKC